MVVELSETVVATDVIVGITTDELLDEYLEQAQNNKELDNEAYDMAYMNEDFYDGNFDGVGAPEEEYDDYADYN